ncbi:DNA cytosine methyltransferase [Patescibacteria group bacterium]|nr:DNA cytosine methyltransferase [Patescibacteria group bacterium]
MYNYGYTGISLFSGAGGLSYGLSKAGFDMRIGIDIDSNAALTLKMNNNIDVIISDIKNVNPTEITKEFNVDIKDIALIAGGPPCQGFSQSNRRSRNLDNPLNNLYLEFFRFVKALNPQVFLLENVAGLKTLHNGKIVKDILKVAKRLGYQVQYDIINAEDFGVPQRRKRIIFIGTKKKASNLLQPEQSNIVSVRDALNDLPILENGNNIDELNYSKNKNLSNYQKLMRNNSQKSVKNNLVSKNRALVLKRYKYIPQGGNWQDIPSTLMSNYKNVKNCHAWIYYRLIYDEPSVVISNYRKNMLIHPEQNRGLSVREAARIQSFPDSYIFFGEFGSQQQQVANAVPPIMAEKIGEKMINYIEEEY